MMLTRICAFLIRISLSAFTAGLVAVPLTGIAAKQRGHTAYGGEWLAILAVFVLVYYLGSKRIRPP